MKAPGSTLLFVVLSLALAFSLFACREKPWNPTRVVGIVVAAPSLALWYIARIQLGSSFSVRPKATELVTHGLYSRIRHPIYLFSASLILGVILYLDCPDLLWVFVLLVPVQLLRIRKEEKVLKEKFGEAYLAYKKRTWF